MSDLRSPRFGVPTTLPKTVLLDLRAGKMFMKWLLAPHQATGTNTACNLSWPCNEIILIKRTHFLLFIKILLNYANTIKTAPCEMKNGNKIKLCGKKKKKLE